jgi:hypothetical protein
MMSAGRSRTRLALTAATLAIVAALLAPVLLAGCGSTTNPAAQKLINTANAHISDAAAEIKAVQQIKSDYSELANASKVTKETATSAIGILDKARQAQQRALEELKSADKSLAGIKDMKVGGDLKKYVDIKLQAIGELEGFLNYEISAMDLRIKTINDKLAGIGLDTLTEQQKRIETMDAAAAQHLKQADALNQKASTFYEEKKIGQ